MLNETLSRNQEIVQDLATHFTLLHFDVDHTITSGGIPHDEEGHFDPTQLEVHEVKSLQLLVELTIQGVVPSAITARDASFFPLASYLQKLLFDRMRRLNRLGTECFFSDGRPKTLDGKPLIFTVSVGNGALSADLLGREYIYHQVLPPEFWAGISDPQVRYLLSSSSPRLHTQDNRRVTPQYFTESDHGEEPSEYIKYQQAIGEFALLSPLFTRVNLSLSAELVSQNPKIKKLWKTLTGITIQTQTDLRAAFLRLSQDWQVYVTGSSSSPTFDITHKDVNKASCMNHIQGYVETLYQEYGVLSTQLTHVAIGDTPDGNDGPMLKQKGGISVREPNETVEGWPVFFDQGEALTKRTNLFLSWLLATRFPNTLS